MTDSTFVPSPSEQFWLGNFPKNCTDRRPRRQTPIRSSGGKEHPFLAATPYATRCLLSPSLARYGKADKHRTSRAAHGRVIRHPRPEHPTLLTTSNSLAKPQGNEVNHQERLRCRKSPLKAMHSDHELECCGELATESRTHRGKNAKENRLIRSKRGPQYGGAFLLTARLAQIRRSLRWYGAACASRPRASAISDSE